MSVAASLEDLLKRMVDIPEEVEVEEFSTSQARVLEARVAEEDLGKVIGRQGRTARAVRTLLNERGRVEDEQYEFEILDE